MHKRMDLERFLAPSTSNHLLPRMCTLRRVPMQYRRRLPLSVMRQLQCVIIGEEKGVLTVAVTEQRNIARLELLSQLTGCAIFPVLVSSARIHLLIKRLERAEREKFSILGKGVCMCPRQIHAMLLFLTASNLPLLSQ